MVKQSAARWLIILGTITGVIGIGLFLFSPIVQVRDIRVQRQDARLDIEKVKRAVAPIFGRHLLFLPRYEVESVVRKAIPDAKEVRIKKRYPSRLTVQVMQQPLIARLILELPAVPSASGAVVPPSATPQVKRFEYLTEDGRYVRIPTSSSGAALPLITIKDIGIPPETQDQLLSPEFLARLQEAERILNEDFGTKVLYRTVYLRGREFHLAPGRLSLWFDEASPLQEQFTRYQTFLQSPGAAEAQSYVDLRLSGVVVYR